MNSILLKIAIIYFVGVGIATIEIIAYSYIRKSWVDLSTLGLAFLSWLIVLIDVSSHLGKLFEELGKITVFDFREKK